jgi:16S rRNA (guanine966-N2)-methyltransferase
MGRANQNSKESSLRIIAGSWKGRRIRFMSDGIRPTGDRIRETLFNWLDPWIRDANCLDMFAGTGALGLEALSRGAASVLLVEKNRQAAQRLKQNIALLDAIAGRVITGDARKLDYASHGPFDIVFLDPPFDSPGGKNSELSNLCTLLESAGCLSTDAHIYIESARQSEWPELPPNWEVIRDRAAGQVRYALARRAADTATVTAQE